MSKQAVRLVAVITAKAREDGGLINMGCLDLTLMLMGFPKNVLQLKALVFRGRRKKNIRGSLSNITVLVGFCLYMYVCAYDTSKTKKRRKKKAIYTAWISY